MLGNVLSNILLIASPVLLATGAIRITNPMNVTIDIIIVLFRFNSPTTVAEGKLIVACLFISRETSHEVPHRIIDRISIHSVQLFLSH